MATAAYNEEKLIEKVIQSIVSQTVRPKKWVIVNDGSTDRTAEIVQKYAGQYPFIELYTITEEHPRDLTAQVHAINRGFAQLKQVATRFIGNLDADVTLEPTYFERLLGKFDEDPRLGLAGGFIHEEKEGRVSKPQEQCGKLCGPCGPTVSPGMPRRVRGLPTLHVGGR